MLTILLTIRKNSTVLEKMQGTTPGLTSSLSVDEPYSIGSVPNEMKTLLPQKQTLINNDLITIQPYIGCMSEIVSV